jgi:hypothetical protein
MTKKLLLFVVFTLFICRSALAQGDSVANAEQFCSGGAELVFNNITGSPNNSTVGCLGSIPNSSYYYLEIDRPGDLVFTISQNDLGGTPIDVDFVAWGPFTSVTAADAAINLAPCTPTACPDNSFDPTFYPYAPDSITDCSWSAAPIENLSINGATTGEIYIVLITNYSDIDGNISIQQTAGTGSTSCSGIPVCGTGFYDNGEQTGDYSNNEVNNTVTIYPDNAGGIVTVTFNTFDLADAGDTLAVYDSDTATNLIGTYTGTTITGSFTSTDPSGALTFVFNSNAAGVSAGWDADVTCTDPPPTPICGTTFTDSGGSGGDYSNDEYSITTFYPDTAGEVVTVTFTSFDIEPFFFDYMNVYDGPNTTVNSIIGQITGFQTGLSFTSTHPSGALTFLFVSDFSNTFPGWSADITCSVPASDCGISFYDTGGSGGNYSNDQFLFNTFYPDNPGDLVTATVNDFDVEDGYDYLYVIDGTDPFVPPIGVFTGTTIDASFTSTDPSGALTFVFISDFIGTSTGWDIDITCVDPTSSCGTIFYDDGGVSGNYSNGQTNATTTFFPDNLGDVVTATFVSFYTQNNDILSVYDGPDATYPSLGDYEGTTIPGPFTSTDASGALTFVFNSTNGNNQDGWAANITCSTPPSPCVVVIRDIPNGASCNPLYTELTVSDNSVFSENFDALGTPAGWTIVNGRNNTQWFASSTSNAGGEPNEFVLAWLNGNRNRNDTWSLTSPSININGYTNLELSYYQFLADFDFANYPYSIFVETSIDAGAWVTQTAITPTGDVGPNIPNIDLSALSGNTLEIRFRMTGMPYGFFEWALDNILVTGDGPPSGAQITWSPTTDLYTDSSLTTPYTGGFADTVYANPSSTITYTATDASTSCTYDVDVVIDLKIWDGSADDDWMNPSNWSDNTIPTAADCVIIPVTGNDPVIYATDNGNGLNLTIRDGAILTQQSNSTLTIVNTINIENGGTYNMLDSASLIQTDNVANTVDGTFTMERITNIRQNDYVYWSSPVTTFNIENISPGTPNGFKYQWLPTVASGYGNWQGFNTGAMDVGKGYIARGPSGHPTTPSPLTAIFDGTPNNGDIVQPIARGTYIGANYDHQPYPGGDMLTVTSDDDNWNLIGNPYPSAINATSFLTLPANTNIEGFVYLWTHGTDIGTGNVDSFYEDYTYNYSVADYLTYNSSGTSTPTGFSGNIGSGQGFFVLMNDTATLSETITFENNMRSNAYGNNQFYRNSNTTNEENENVNRIWLDFITPSEATNTTLVAYVNGATNNADRMFDAIRTKGNGLNIYSLINEKTYIIQGRQLPFIDSDEVPVGVNISEAGIQTIAINTLQGLFHETEQNIYIEDLVSGTIHNLKNSPYSFVSESGTFNDRLILRYTNRSLGIDDFDSLNGIKVFEENEKIVVKSSYEPIESIEVYDLLGRTLYTNPSINLERFTISSLSPNTATLFLKIKLTNGKQKIAKIIF